MLESLPTTMRAWAVKDYGGPDVLELINIPLPPVKPYEMLIKVQATTVSSGDRRIRSLDFPLGMGLLGRAFFGVRRPRRPILGAELTGIVVAIGPKISRFSLGDEIIAFSGIKMGAHAEFCIVSEKGLVVTRPKEMTIQTAASLGFGGTTALDFLRRAKLKQNENVLVIGASGTVGSAIVQLAKHFGANVTGVTSGKNIELVRNLGATSVIDYTNRDVTLEKESFDIIADAVGAYNFKGCLPILNEGGRYLSINGGLKDMIIQGSGTRRSISGPAAERIDDLAELVKLATSGHFKPLIDSIIPFINLPKAHQLADSGRKKGSIVIQL